MELRTARFFKRLTLVDLRNLTGISATKLSLIERGKEKANEQEKKIIGKAL